MQLQTHPPARQTPHKPPPNTQLVTLTYAVIAATITALALTAAVIHLTRAHHAAKRLPTITEQQAQEHARPLTHAILNLSPIQPPINNQTED